MNKRALAFVAISVLALTACGGEQKQAQAEETSTTTPAPVEAPKVVPVERETTPEPEPSEEFSDVNDRGNFVSEIGNIGSLENGAGEMALSFTIDAIEPSVCTDVRQGPPENGHLYTITMTVEATAILGDSTVPTNPSAFNFISEDGTTFNAELGTLPAYSCLPDQETLPGQVGPGEKVVGNIVVDIPSMTGTLVYNPTYGQTESYEYSF